MKDAYYFSHDANARRDPKCSALLSEYGCLGYGVYWGIIEILHEQGGKIKKFPKLYEGIAHQFYIGVDELTKLIDAMLGDYQLLLQDENYIWSDRVLRNIEERKSKYLNKVEAGRIGGIRSGETRKTKQNEAVLEANEQKESKVKESKGKERKETDSDAIAVLEYLNLKASSKYSTASAANKKFISARLLEGRTVEDLKSVVDKKTAEWKGTDWEKYLRPETLFNATKFEGYFNQQGDRRVSTKTTTPSYQAQATAEWREEQRLRSERLKAEVQTGATSK